MFTRFKAAYCKNAITNSVRHSSLHFFSEKKLIMFRYNVCLILLDIPVFGCEQ